MNSFPNKYPANMPTLHRNIMDGLPSDFARDFFLWAIERSGEDQFCYRSEKLAREADSLVKAWRYLREIQDRCRFRNGDRLLDEDQSSDLEHFVFTRWANWRYGKNTKFPKELLYDGGRDGSYARSVPS